MKIIPLRSYLLVTKEKKTASEGTLYVPTEDGLSYGAVEAVGPDCTLEVGDRIGYKDSYFEVSGMELLEEEDVLFKTI